MPLRLGSASLSLLVVLTAAAAIVSCRNKTSDALDAASDAAAGDARTGDAMTALADGGPTDGGVALAAATPGTASLPRPTPFSGTYRCFKSGIQLEQVGNIVTSTMHKDSTTDTIIACTAIGDMCTGTMRDIQLAKTKSKKVGNIRPVTLLRTAAGDVLVKMGTEQKAASSTGSRSSSSSKAAGGDQTFCQRR